MPAAVAAILEGMPEPRDLRMHEHDGRCVITAGTVVLFDYAAGDVVMRNIALAVLRQLGFRGRAVAAALGLSEAYVATLHSAAKRDGSAALAMQDRRGTPGKVTAAQWEQARAWREQGASDAEIGRRLGVANTTVGRGLAARPPGRAPGSGTPRARADAVFPSLNAIVAVMSTPFAAPVSAAARLRCGNAASGRGAASLRRAGRCHRAGLRMRRHDHRQDGLGAATTEQ